MHEPASNTDPTRQSATLLDLALARGTLDRSGRTRADPGLIRRLLADPATRVIDLADGMVRACKVNGGLRLVLRAPTLQDTSRLALFLGRDDAGTAYLAVVGPRLVEQDRAGTSGKAWRSLREVGADLSDVEAGAVTTAVALANWHDRHPRCPQCGAPTEPAEGGWLRRCPEDGSEHHPRTDPAVIVAVCDPQDRILLARGPHWPARRLSVLAGFLEVGESLESAVLREVHEEVGLQVDSIVYRGNQPWPFPASLMVGFSARTDSTALEPDNEEIATASWFSRGELAWAARSGEVLLPHRVSIARHLIEQWYGGAIEVVEEITDPFPGRPAAS